VNDCTFNNCDIRLKNGHESSVFRVNCGAEYQENTLKICNSKISAESVITGRGKILFSNFDSVKISDTTFVGPLMLKPQSSAIFINDCKLLDTTFSQEVEINKESSLFVNGLEINISNAYLNNFADSSALVNLSNVDGTLRLMLSKTVIVYSGSNEFRLLSSNDDMQKLIAILDSIILDNKTEYAFRTNIQDTEVKKFYSDKLIGFADS
jgi:hypothetical protein